MPYPENSPHRSRHTEYDNTEFWVGDLVVKDGLYCDVRSKGAKPDGLTDSTAAIQSAIDGGGTIIFPSGTGNYLHTGLTITSDNVKLIGPQQATRSTRTGWETGVGSTLEYTGTSGTALLIGQAPDTNGNYISGTHIENINMLVTQNTDIAMRVWHSYGGIFKNMTIFGNSDNDGSTNYGLKVEAGVYNKYDNININGSGVDDVGWLADKALGYGLYHTLGYGGTVPTTTTYHKVFGHYCDINIYQDSFANFYDCVSEANKGLQGVEFGVSARGTWINCWHEDMDTSLVRFSGSAGYIRFINNHFNFGTKQMFFRSATHSGKVRFDGCRFASTHASPQIFDNSDSWAGLYIFDQCEFLANTTMLGTGRVGWHLAKIESMQIDVLRFIQTSVAANTYYRCVPIPSGFVGDKYRMTQDGNIIGINMYYRNVTNIVASATYKWTASGSGTNEYYCELLAGGDPSLSDPESVWGDGSDFPFAEGTLGSLAIREWGYGDNDTLGYSTVYVRLTDGTDPDGKADAYVKHLGKMTAGTYDIVTYKNDVLLPAFSYSTVAAQSGDLTWNEDFLKTTFVAGDWFNFQLHTDAAFAPTGGDMVIEIIVAYGDDGLP